MITYGRDVGGMTAQASIDRGTSEKTSLGILDSAGNKMANATRNYSGGDELRGLYQEKHGPKQETRGEGGQEDGRTNGEGD